MWITSWGGTSPPPFDINFKTDVIKVYKSHSVTKNVVKEKSPKSQNGYREVPMPTFVSQYLKQYIESLNHSDGKEPIYLMHKRNGTKMTKSSYDKMWRQITRKINIAAGGTDDHWVINGLTTHVFRHNFCTNLCYQIPEISIEKIAELMGDTKKMVLDVYSHILAEKEDAKAVVNKALNF